MNKAHKFLQSVEEASKRAGLPFSDKIRDIKSMVREYVFALDTEEGLSRILHRMEFAQCYGHTAKQAVDTQRKNPKSEIRIVLGGYDNTSWHAWIKVNGEHIDTFESTVDFEELKKEFNSFQEYEIDGGWVNIRPVKVYDKL